ncbi:mushroom body large-type Kenyon cell-specific protein 1-like isoform X4 [Linepithema humile]|uniref:mushroom body large-type Kenyon cell-specific protein 1-like isoform X4 n=1 Tax=Linepithema humile TaxID=83485 RepID=UPI00062380B8|nr:PREDICTED: mushroom body large-type Kenyon cell-specific protein 1-like isoform X3 [Linepithema humile]
MADCPYARCIQERRHIRRELLRWTKNMVFVVGLERVAEELMGRRRWKHYQDTLYSGTRSSESATAQPHHRLYPALSSSCNPIPGSLDQIGPQLHHPVPSSLPPSAVASTVLTTATTTTTTTAATTLATGVVKQESLQRHHLQNHHHLQTSDHHPQPEDSRRLRPGEIKVEAADEEPADGVAREDTSARTADTATSATTTTAATTTTTTTATTTTTIGVATTTSSTTTATGTTTIATRRRRGRRQNDGEDADGEEDGDENDDETGRSQNEAEKRLKLDEDADRSAASPLRTENDRATRDHPTANATDTEGTKERAEEITLERAPVTQGLLRVKKEEELQEVPGSGGGTTILTTPATESEGTRSGLLCREGNATATSAAAPFLLGRRRSPPPEDWKPLDKCYFCLDGKLPHDDQAPLDNNISLLEQQKIPLRMPTGIDPKSILNSCYRAKPRMTGPVAAAAAAAAAAVAGVGGVPVVGAGGGRRTYTEEELQAALRDIQSGKLGTRRAAVIYGIPRSTLRNKVYKLAMERERDASLTSTHSHPHEPGAPATTTTTITTTTTTTTTTTPPNTTQNASATTPPPQVDEVDDKELSGAEEEKEVEKALLKPLLSLEDLVRFSALEGTGGDSLRNLLQRGHEAGAEWPGLEHANIGPYIQKMLAGVAPLGIETRDYRIPDVVRKLMSEDKRLNKNVNGDQSQPHHQSHHHQQHHPLAAHQTQSQQQQRAPMTNDDFNPNIEEEASDSAQGRAILKIPSYKPASTPGCSSKNGEPTSAAFAQSFAAAASSPGLLERASPAFSGTSSPTNSLVGKAVAVNFRDVIAKSISVKFQEGQTPGAAGMPGCQSAGAVSSQQAMMTDPSPFKRGRYTPPQPQQQQQSASQQQQQQSKQQAQDANKPKPGTGGKGTRPKRGKYRNYDRDSLVEAVRAVQRGEMSVHRAGSFYGVPHSTLEYKVKERHLMRPRKRDQKQPDDKSKETATTAAAAAAAMRPSATGVDKKPQLKPQKPFTPPGGIPGPNGLKMPPFIEGMPHLPFGPFNFWNPTPFMPSPFIGGAPNVPILPEQYFASQRMRGLQEQQRNAAIVQQHQQQRDRDGVGVSGTTDAAGTSNSRSTPMVKTPRDMVESIYDGPGANGSFLDNLIRSSLETGIPRDQRALAEARTQQQQQQQSSSQHPETMSSKTLIDQLCRNSRRTPLPRMAQDSSEDESYRGPAGRMVPERPERVPTVDLSPSPSERGRTDDGSDRLTSPPTPLSISRAGSRDEDSTRDSRIDRSSREREVHNGGQEDRDRKQPLSLTQQQQQQQPQLNHYPDIHNLYAVSTDKKSACDSKLIVDHSSQKTQPQQQQKEYAAVSGLVVQLQRGYNTGSNRSGEPTNSQQPAAEQRGAALSMEDSVEQ